MSGGADLLSQSEEPPRFADGKDEGALRTIGEVAKVLGIRPHVLRYWEEQFPSLKPLKRSGGRRYYRSEDVQMVETIDRLVHREGYTLKGAKQALQHGAAKGAARTAPASLDMPVAVTAVPAGNQFASRARLIALRTTLVQALHDS